MSTAPSASQRHPQPHRPRHRREHRFYCDVLGFTVKDTVPDAAPFVFVWLERGGVTVFLNDPAAVAKDLPA